MLLILFLEIELAKGKKPDAPTKHRFRKYSLCNLGKLNL
jgi:hypothetical protein